MLIQEMYDARGVVVKQQSDLNDLTIKEGREFTSEEQEQYGKMDVEYQRLTGAIERSKKATAREDEEKRLALANTPAPPDTNQDDDDDPEKRDASAKAKRSKAYCKAFEKYVRSGAKTPELRASTDPQTVGTDADGGFTVPDEWMKELIVELREENVMRQLARTITTSSGTLHWPANSAHGSAAWYSENSSIAVSKETFSEVTLTPYKGARIITISEELLEDSMFDMEAFLREQLVESIGELQETGFVAGDGSSKPSGVAEATVGAATGVTAASATVFTIDELMELYHSIGTKYRKKGVWLMNDTSALIMRKLKDGNGRYLWEDSVQVGQPDRFLGKQVVTAEDMPAATTTNNAVLFGDFKRAYTINDRVGIRIKRLNELYQVNDLIGFKATARTDGKIVESAAVRALTMA